MAMILHQRVCFNRVIAKHFILQHGNFGTQLLASFSYSFNSAFLNVVCSKFFDNIESSC